jgi:antitoxin component YwqK of YwqJK toxin-antitoxin module
MRIDIDGDEVSYDDAQRLLYRDELFTGEAAEYGPGRVMVALVSYVRGQEDGQAREWFPDGTLMSEGTSRKGYPVGIWRTWHWNGRLAEETVFEDEPDGRGPEAVRRWSEDGESVDGPPAW